MKKFTRPSFRKASTATLDIDFGAAAQQVARVFEPDVYTLRIETARVVQNNANISIATDIIEVESGARVDTRPIWVDGPNAGAGQLTAANQHLIAQLLTLAGQPTAGNVSTLVPHLSGLVFEARLALNIDSRTGRTFNVLADIFPEGAS
ncbi:MAG TPA: hypothetical protein VIF02_04100 [Methylocella sp.]|jgi:hypothetical protein